MKWIYILRCEDNIYYIGQTKRLYRRFWEHQDGKGGKNTYIYSPEAIVAIYKLSDIVKFIDYNDHVKKILSNIWHTVYEKWKLHNFDNDDDNDNDNDNYYHENQEDNFNAENNIAECMMIHNKDNWKNIRGGKYIRFDCQYKFPNNEYIKELPLCKCGLPCDIKKHLNKERLYFRCAKKNMWDDFKENFDIEVQYEPCNFYQEYLIDIELIIQANKNFDERKKKLGELIKNSTWLENVPNDEDEDYDDVTCDTCDDGTCCYCHKYIWNDRTGTIFKENGGIKYYNQRKALCFNCFIDRNEELSKKYSTFKNGKCLIQL